LELFEQRLVDAALGAIGESGGIGRGDAHWRVGSSVWSHGSIANLPGERRVDGSEGLVTSADAAVTFLSVAASTVCFEARI
jgi:hypothetical protein